MYVCDLCIYVCIFLCEFCGLEAHGLTEACGVLFWILWLCVCVCVCMPCVCVCVCVAYIHTYTYVVCVYVYVIHTGSTYDSFFGPNKHAYKHIQTFTYVVCACMQLTSEISLSWVVPRTLFCWVQQTCIQAHTFTYVVCVCVQNCQKDFSLLGRTSDSLRWAQ